MLDAVTITYMEISPLLDRIAARFADLYGPATGGFDETRIVSDEAFLKAYESHRPNGGRSFKSWVSKKVWKELHSYLRTELHYRKERRVAYELDSLPKRPYQEFNFSEFTADMSKDAKQVVKLTITSPPQVRRLMRQQIRNTPARYKRALRAYLLDVGWSSLRVAQSFNEVREALHKGD